MNGVIKSDDSISLIKKAVAEATHCVESNGETALIEKREENTFTYRKLRRDGYTVRIFYEEALNCGMKFFKEVTVESVQRVYWTLYWLGGKRQILEGTTIEKAFSAAGYGSGALSALDFYQNGIDDRYEYDTATSEWRSKDQVHVPLSIKLP